MGTSNASRRIAPYRLRRIAGGSAGFAALAVMAMMVLSPMASAYSPAVKFKGSSPYLNSYWSLNGCAHGKVSKPGFSLVTGFGKVAFIGKSNSCPKAKGGALIGSYFSASTGLGLTESVKLTKAASSVAIKWSIKGSASDSAVGTFAKCPVTSYSYSYNIGPSWVFVNYSYSDCYAQAGYSVSSYPEVHDITTGSYYGPSTYFNIYNNTGNYHYFYKSQVNYSNTSYATNSTSTYAYNYSYGASNTTTFNIAPTWYINGTFNLGDHLVIYAQVSNSAYAEIYGETHAKAAAALSATGTTGHEDLTSITIT